MSYRTISQLRTPETAYPLVSTLIRWGVDHTPRAIDALMDSLDIEFQWRCVGGIFRRAVAADPSWLWTIADRHPDQLLALSPYIKSITWESMGYPAYWGSIPGRMSWKEWLIAGDAIRGPWSSATALLAECEHVGEKPEQPEAIEPDATPRRVKRERETQLFGATA